MRFCRNPKHEVTVTCVRYSIKRKTEDITNSAHVPVVAIKVFSLEALLLEMPAFLLIIYQLTKLLEIKQNTAKNIGAV